MSTTPALTDASESTPAPTKSASTPGPQPSERAVAERDAQIDGELVHLELLELRRSGATSTLTIRLSTALEDGRAQVAGTFSDGVISDAEGVGHANTLDGISLVDGANRKRYLVARDSRGVCVCDGDLGSAFVKARAPIILSATFAAPPPDAGAVDVAIPRFGTFHDVPVS